MKKETQNTSATPSNPEAPIRILKVGTCLTLSGKGTLQYHLGCTSDGGILFRVYANSGSGYFSREWIEMKAIHLASSKIPADKPVTSYLLLNPLFHGRSTNTPAFLMAVLKQEGLVMPADGDDRCFVRTDGAKFFAEVKSLIESDVDIKIVDKPSKQASSKAEVTLKKSASKPRQKDSIGHL